MGAAGIATMLFYNQVLGLSASLCGVVFLIASVVDGISDPILGAFSDQFKSRWGRRHPLMFLSAFPLAISFYCLYQPPEGLSETGLFVWFLLFMILTRTAKTFYTVPHAALGAELTEDYHERTSIFGYNAVTGMVGGVGFGVFLLVVVFPSTADYGNGLLNEGRYALLAAFGAVTIVVSLFACTFGTRDQIPYLCTSRRHAKSGLASTSANFGSFLAIAPTCPSVSAGSCSPRPLASLGWCPPTPTSMPSRYRRNS